MALSKHVIEEICAIDTEALAWATALVDRLKDDERKNKLCPLIKTWIKEVRYQKLPIKTRERIWAVAYLLSKIEHEDKVDEKE